MSAPPAPRSWLLASNKANQSSIRGRYPNSWFGGTLVTGDINGDGFPDLITSARFANTKVPAGGEVYAVPGPLALNEVYTMPQRAALIFQGTSASQMQLGINLASGDMNGDGIDDIVMGDLTTDKTYVYLGSPNIRSSSPITVAAVPEKMALTLAPGGSGLVLCDINGDGYRDLFVEQLIDHGNQFEMQIWGVLGSPSLTMTHPLTWVLPSQADVVIQGFYPSAWSGPVEQNLACGDIDGDGVPDLALGIFGDNPGGRLAAGTVYIVRGSRAITSGHPVTLTMPDQAGAIIEGVGAGDFFGMTIASADVNRDGRADLIIGAPRAWGLAGSQRQYAGEVYEWLGRALTGQRFVVSSQASWIVQGDEPYAELGSAIATGDFDKDGYPEILLGCPGCAQQGPPSYVTGQGYVLKPLQITGQLTVDAASQLNIVPNQDASCLGTAVTALDLNGDGFSDLVLSADCGEHPGYTLPGTVYTVSYPDHYRNWIPALQR